MAALLAGIGCFGLLAQVFLLRELAVVFLGHELSFGLALAAWLFWTGLGSFSERRAQGDGRRCAKPLPLVSGGGTPAPETPGAVRKIAFLGLAAPLTLLAARFAKLLTPPGVLPGLFEGIAVPLLLLSPFCWLSGSVFGSLCRLAAPERLYCWESVGALAAGLAATFALVGRCPALAVLSIGGAVVSALSMRLARPAESIGAGLLCLALAAGSGRLDAWSRPWGLGGLRLVEQREGRYGYLALAAAGATNVLFQNGTASVSFPDPAAEEEVHWPLLAHPKPRSVLALGFGTLPALTEILKHPVNSVEVVEADAEALDMVRRRLDAGAARAAADPRVRLVVADPREFLRSRPGAYDVVLQLGGDPMNAAGNRFFTREFFAQARSALSADGILAFTLPSAENYLAPETAYADASVYNALTAVFASSTALIPGSRMTLLAGPGRVSLDPARLAAAYGKRAIKNRAVVPPAFMFYLMPERRDALARRLAGMGKVAANADLKPIAYFHTWRVWLLKFVSPAHLLGLIAAGALSLWGLAKLWTARAEVFRSWEDGAVLCLGFSGIGLEIALLLAFQAASGALYWKMGLLLGAFMAGLAGGSLLGALKPLGPAKSRLALRLVLLAMALGELALAWGLPRLAVLDPGRLMAVFCCLLGAGGFLVGWSYPLACERSPARTYAADLWGAALGAFLTAAFIVPLAGIPAALALGAAAVLPALLWPAAGRHGAAPLGRINGRPPDDGLSRR
ncbi:MAG: hypothetical protein HY927_17135 [Elusimicrobia bacterium]|nr:hypothetical protein [Elusimicrobiota bacterium]